MQVPILSGIKADNRSNFRTAYPRNYVPVPKDNGISKGYLYPADGIVQTGTGFGADRGGINWKGKVYRVSGNKLIRQEADGSIANLGEMGTDGKQVTLTYSFDRLAIASAGNLYYWTGSSLLHVVDPDLGTCLDVVFIEGYFFSTDGEFLVVTDLNDPMAVNPLKYGSAEADPDPVIAVAALRNEAYALGRFTIEVFQNIGGTGFPFQRIDGAEVPRGIIGKRAFCEFLETFAFVGSGRNEAPGVYLMLPGSSRKLSTTEIDKLIAALTEEQLSSVVMEAKIGHGVAELRIHLPDQCLVYDYTASQELEQPVWHTLDSGLLELATYRARGLVWCYDRWNAGDPTGPALGRLTDETMDHFEQKIGWTFGTIALYMGGNDGIVHEAELIGLPGRVAFGADPVIWVSYSHDGQTWSQEKAIHAGKQGERQKRLMWRPHSKIHHYQMLQFRGTSDARISFARLEMQIEPLQTRPSYG